MEHIEQYNALYQVLADQDFTPTDTGRTVAEVISAGHAGRYHHVVHQDDRGRPVIPATFFAVVGFTYVVPPQLPHFDNVKYGQDRDGRSHKRRIEPDRTYVPPSPGFPSSGGI